MIGGGQAGLAAAYHLKQAGRRFLVLEAGGAAGGSWRSYYDSLVLFSPAAYCSLPGLPFPGDPDHYPTRDEVVAYLLRYAAELELPVRSGARVSSVIREGDLFQVSTSAGSFEARAVIAATGSFGHPYVPDLPGRADFRGQVLHAFDYRNPEPFHGRRVVVVGGANSAVQIGIELARTARVTLALRSRIHWVPQRILGFDGHFWLRVTGLDKSRLLSDQSTPVVDPGGYRRAVAAGQPDSRPMFTRFTETGVVWRGGIKENVDTVLFATGYRPDLGYLAPLGALGPLGADGRPRQRAGISTTVPGLYFMGLSGQRNFASATLRGVGSDAEIVVRDLEARLRQNGKSPAPTSP